jgi:6-pyruvoyltetrahydropterin/6-carboxytetrahydropterin synthase
MYTISKDFSFSAGHKLIDLPDDHQCARIHGHNYTVRLVLAANELQPVGFVRDYGDLKMFKQLIDDQFDHRWLGFGMLAEYVGGVEPDQARILRKPTAPVVDFNPTAENLAKYFYGIAIALFPEMSSVGVSETDKTWAYYAPEQRSLHG